MHDFFDIILKSTAAIISSVVLLFAGTPSHSVPPTQPASSIVAVAPSAQDSGSMVSTPAPVSSTTVANDPAPVALLPTKNTAPTSLFVPQPASVAAPPNSAGISKNYVDDQLQILRNSLSSEIFKYSSTQFPNAPGISQYTANLAVSQRIDQLTGTRLSNITVSGVSGLTAADIPTDITASNYLPLTGGALSGTLTTTGNVGIGTTAPLAKLSIKGAGSTTGVNFQTTNSSDSPLFTILDSGKVGIGTTTPTSNLDVWGTATLSRDGATPHFDLFSYGATSQLKSYFTGRAASGSLASPGQLSSGDIITTIYAYPYNGTSFSSVGGALEFYTDGTHTPSSIPTALRIQTAPSGSLSRLTRVTVDNAGNVGIGTTTPWGLLSVNANGLASSSPQFVVGSSTRTNFIVANNGNVGIGTTSPASRLHIEGPNDATGGLTISSTLGTSNNRLAIYPFGNGSTKIQTLADGDLYFRNQAEITTMILTNSRNVGIGSSTPWGLLSVNANGLASSSPQFVVGSSTRTNFIVDTAGSIGIGSTTPWRTLAVTGTVGFDGLTGSTGAGSLCLSANKEVVYNSGSDSCLSSTRITKHDIVALGVSGSAAINALQPVSFVYNNDASSTVRYGFIAEDAAAVDAHLATYDAAGAISGIDDRSIISILVKALKELLAQVQSLAATVAAMSNRITTKELCVSKSDGTLVCVTGDQLASIGSTSSNSSGSASSTPDTTPPVITISGANPAQLQIGDTYSDLGATVTDNIDQNLGVHAFVGATPIEQAFIDTSAATTYHIDYVATDAAGNTATSTRTVVIEAGE